MPERPFFQLREHAQFLSAAAASWSLAHGAAAAAAESDLVEEHRMEPSSSLQSQRSFSGEGLSTYEKAGAAEAHIRVECRMHCIDSKQNDSCMYSKPLFQLLFLILKSCLNDTGPLFSFHPVAKFLCKYHNAVTHFTLLCLPSAPASPLWVEEPFEQSMLLCLLLKNCVCIWT